MGVVLLVLVLWAYKNETCKFWSWNLFPAPAPDGTSNDGMEGAQIAKKIPVTQDLWHRTCGTGPVAAIRGPCLAGPLLEIPGDKIWGIVSYQIISAVDIERQYL